MPFFPLALHFTTFWLGHAQKSKFGDKPSGFFNFFFFAFPFSHLFVAVNGLLLGLLPVQNHCTASLRRAIFTTELLSVFAENFAAWFSLIFLSIFMRISGSIEKITLIWVSLERCVTPAKLEYR